MLIVHHLGLSQSDRIVWLCEELGLAYELRRYDRDPQTKAAPPDYKALHPFGTAPVIEDGELVLAESGAIVEYICRKHTGGRLLLGPEHPEYGNFLFWFHFANGSVLPAVTMDMAAVWLGIEPDAARAHPTGSRTDKAYAMAEERLGEASFFAGDALSAADIMMLFTLTTMRRFAPRDMAPYPNIRAYLQRVGTRPAYLRAMAKADPGVAPLVD